MNRALFLVERVTSLCSYLHMYMSLSLVERVTSLGSQRLMYMSLSLVERVTPLLTVSDVCTRLSQNV